MLENQRFYHLREIQRVTIIEQIGKLEEKARCVVWYCEGQTKVFLMYLVQIEGSHPLLLWQPFLI